MLLSVGFQQHKKKEILLSIPQNCNALRPQLCQLFFKIGWIFGGPKTFVPALEQSTCIRYENAISWKSLRKDVFKTAPFLVKLLSLNIT